nr:zinc finger, CCHC-type [Tanacetum cinerariifolium]
MTVIIMTVVPVTTLLSGRLMPITTLLPLVWSLSVIIIPLMEDLIVASSIGNLSHIRKRDTHELVKGRLAKTPLEVLCLLLRSTSSCSEEPIKLEETLHKLRTSLSIRLANRVILPLQTLLLSSREKLSSPCERSNSPHLRELLPSQINGTGGGFPPKPDGSEPVRNSSRSMNRLGRVHFKRMKDMSKDGLIPTLTWTLKSDAIFDENRFSSVPRPSLKIPIKTKDIGSSVVPKEFTKEVVHQPKLELKKSKKNKTPKDFGPKFHIYLFERTKDEVSDQHSYWFNVKDGPKIFDKAMKSQDVSFWKEAIKDEMDSIMGNNTWCWLIYLQVANLLVTNGSSKEKCSGAYQYHKTDDCYGINSQSDYSSDGCEDNFLE